MLIDAGLLQEWNCDDPSEVAAARAVRASPTQPNDAYAPLDLSPQRCAPGH